VSLYIPSSYSGQTNLPLVVMLHGYYGDSAYYESQLQIQPLAEARGFLYCHPEGITDRFGWGTWNGTDAGADFYNTGIDDAGYLRALIEEIGRRFAMDRKRVHLVGVFVGGFMAHRMACDSADLIAGIAAGGLTFLDPGRCRPSEPVNILVTCRTDEELFFYLGGALGPSLPWPMPANMPPYPGALRSVQTWAAYNGACDPVTDPRPSMDLDLVVPGLDTVVTRYTSFPPGGAVELWSIVGGTHLSANGPEFSRRAINWLLAHPKP
jgi:polyhydroxybutyrate depolymerase